MSKSTHGIGSHPKGVVALGAKRRAQTVVRRVEGFGGYRDDQWVETVDAEYTPAELHLVETLVRGGHVDEAAVVHGLKAAFEAVLVDEDGVPVHDAPEPTYEQGALL